MTRSRVSGLVALVAGGGSGIGEATARTFAANGGSVVVADIRKEAADKVASAIVVQGGNAMGVLMDVAKQSDIDAALKETIGEFGKLDVLINTAGVIRAAPLVSCSLEDWRTPFLVNVEGALLLARTCLPHLRKSPVPAIVNCSSLAGGRAYANGGSYGPSKAALISLSRTMAIEWAEFRCSCELRESWLGGDAAGARQRTSRDDQTTGRADSHAPSRSARRARRLDRVPRVACGFLHHGARHQLRWRPVTGPDGSVLQRTDLISIASVTRGGGRCGQACMYWPRPQLGGW